jgi:hypothetical protein
MGRRLERESLTCYLVGERVLVAVVETEVAGGRCEDGGIYY